MPGPATSAAQAPGTPRVVVNLARMSEVAEQVRAVVAAMAGIEPQAIAAEARFSELGLDSVAAVELLGRLETTFDVEIPEADALHLTTLQSVARYVARARR
jgi:acyl carrier protein